MAGCTSRCITFRTDSIQVAWEDIRDYFGPRVAWSTTPGTLAATDVALWTSWSTSKGIDPSDVSWFGKWFVWLLRIGTAEYGNLPTRVRDHVGISCVPCPYSTYASALWTRSWLGLEDNEALPTKTDHGIYYMKVKQNGNSWGFECTDPNCPYYTTNGRAYFHV